MTAPQTRFDRAVAICAIAFAFALALYTGFRVPNAWSATLDSVSLFGGFHRRFVVGTLLHPLAVATGYNYWVFAAWSFAVAFPYSMHQPLLLLHRRFLSQVHT